MSPPRCGVLWASTIAAPLSTKNDSGERDPEMHSTKKSNQRHFGLKTHIGVNAIEGHVHSVATLAAHGSDVHMLPALSQGEELKVWGVTCVSHPEARLRLRRGALPWRRGEPQLAVDKLRPSEFLPASPAAGRPRVELRLRPENGLATHDNSGHLHPTKLKFAPRHHDLNVI